MRPARALLVTAVCLAVAAGATLSHAQGRVWWGGSIGFGSGDVDYYTVEPLIGVTLTSRLSVGGSLIYRYRRDDRYDDSYSSTDTGGTLFGRYYVHQPLFLQAEYEHIRYDYESDSGASGTDSYDSVLGGAGMAFPAGRRASIFAVALYNFSYDDNELRSPYDSPWIYRGGVSIGF